MPFGTSGSSASLLAIWISASFRAGTKGCSLPHGSAVFFCVHKQSPPSEPLVPRPLCSPYGFLHPFVQARWLQSSTWLCCFSFVCISSHHLRNLWFLGRVARHMASCIHSCRHDGCSLPHGSAYARKKPVRANNVCYLPGQVIIYLRCHPA